MIIQENTTEKRYWELKLETIKHKLSRYPRSKQLIKKKLEYLKRLREIWKTTKTWKTYFSHKIKKNLLCFS